MRLVKHKQTSKFYALKILKKSEIVRMRQVEHINSEKAILSQVTHPFIVRMYVFFFFLLFFLVGAGRLTVLLQVLVVPGRAEPLHGL